MTATTKQTRPVAGVSSKTPVRPAIVTGSRRCKVCGMEKPVEAFRSVANIKGAYKLATCYQCEAIKWRNAYRDKSLKIKLAMSKDQLYKSDTGGKSAFNELHTQLQKVRVVHTKTRRIIPKFILWERIGQAKNREYNLHFEKCHPDYEYLTEEQVSRLGYKVTEE